MKLLKRYEHYKISSMWKHLYIYRSTYPQILLAELILMRKKLECFKTEQFHGDFCQVMKYY